jgi:hypothetical protein
MTSVGAAVSMAVCQSVIRSKRGAATEAIFLGAAGWRPSDRMMLAWRLSSRIRWNVRRKSVSIDG